MIVIQALLSSRNLLAPARFARDTLIEIQVWIPL
jgi:hypothetical protein